MPDSRTASILVIGYGNTLRRDDALGCLIADEVGCWQRPGVRSMSLAQLTPELAAELAAAETAVFVDARKCSPSSELRIQVEPLSPRGQDWASLVHAITPCVLLGLCQAVFGQCPRAWLVSVPGSDFSFGEGLSDMADRGMGAGTRHDRNTACPRRFPRTWSRTRVSPKRFSSGSAGFPGLRT